MKEQDLLGCHFTILTVAAESVDEVIRDLFGTNVKSLFKGKRKDDSFVDSLRPEVKVVLNEAEDLIEEVNASIKMAQGSNEPTARGFGIATARAKIIELKRLTLRHPFIQIDRLEEVSLLIAQIEQETIALQYRGKTERGPDGQELERQGRFSEAIVAYEGLVKRVADNPFVYKRLAVLYRMKKSTEDEMRVLMEALKNVSKSSKNHREWFKKRLSKIKRKGSGSSSDG